jgi:hypothetical protein
VVFGRREKFVSGVGWLVGWVDYVRIFLYIVV